MDTFLITSAVLAAILFTAQFLLKKLEESDRNGGIIEPHKRYTLWGIFTGMLEEMLQNIKKKFKRKN